METKAYWVLTHAASSEQYHVGRFSIENWGVSREYQIHLILQTECTSLTVGDKVFLEVDLSYFHGFIVALSTQALESGQETQVILTSPLAFYLQEVKSKVYSYDSISETISAFLSDYGLHKGLDFQVQEIGKPSSIWVQQVEEETLTFFCKLLAGYGWSYRYEQTKEEILCIFSDDLSSMLPKKVKTTQLCPQSKMNCLDEVSSAINVFKQRSGAIVSCHYNPNIPEVERQSSLSIHPFSHGRFYISSKNGADYSSAIQSYEDEKAHQFELNLQDLSVQPGQAVQIDNPTVIDKKYYVLSVSVCGKSHEFWDVGVHERLSVKVLMSSMISGLPPICKRDIIQGKKFATAHIEPLCSKYPNLSKKGNYHLRFQYDSELSKGPFFRNALYYAGNGFGFSYPYENNEKVLVGYENGDEGRPIILGALPKEDSTSIVTQANQDENLLRSRSGSMMLISQKSSMYVFKLQTKAGSNLFALKEGIEEGDLSLCSQKGFVHISALKNISFSTGGEYSQRTLGSQRYWVHKNSTFRCIDGSIDFNSQRNFSIQCQESIRIQSNYFSAKANKKVLFYAKEKIECITGNTIQLSSTQGEQRWIINQGELVVKARKGITFQGGSASVLFTPGSIELSTPGVIQLNAISINGV